MILRLLNFGKKVLKQEALLEKALKEKGIPLKDLKIEIDHLNGKNKINGIETDVIFPESFFVSAEKLVPTDKKIDFYFNGNMSNTGSREDMLKPFMNRKNSLVINSNVGRINFFKHRFNKNYYEGLAQSKFGLCPHQSDWPGPIENIWTYRFIECCMVKSIPVVFDETPLGVNFTNGFHFQLSSEIINGECFYSSEKAESNFKLVKERFSLTDELVLKIKHTLS